MSVEGMSLGFSVPLLPHKAVTQTMQDASPQVCLLDFLSIFSLTSGFAPCPIQIGQQQGLGQHNVTASTPAVRGSPGLTPCWSLASLPQSSLASSPLFLPDLGKFVALMFIEGSGELSSTWGARLWMWAALPHLGTIWVCDYLIKGSISSLSLPPCSAAHHHVKITKLSLAAHSHNLQFRSWASQGSLWCWVKITVLRQLQWKVWLHSATAVPLEFVPCC